MSNGERRGAVDSPCIQPADRPPLESEMEIDDDFDQMLERSSLGSPVAKHIRAGLSEHLARRIQKRERSAAVPAQPPYALDDLVLMLVRMCQDPPTSAFKLRLPNPGGHDDGARCNSQAAMQCLPLPLRARSRIASFKAQITSTPPGHVLLLPTSLQLPIQLIWNAAAQPGKAACILQYLVDEGVIADVDDHVAQTIVSAVFLRIGHAPPALLRACAAALDRESSWPKAMGLQPGRCKKSRLDASARSPRPTEQREVSVSSALDEQECATGNWQWSQPAHSEAVQEASYIVASSPPISAVPASTQAEVRSEDSNTENTRRVPISRLIVPWASIATETSDSALGAMRQSAFERAILSIAIEALADPWYSHIYDQTGSGRTRTFLNTLMASSLNPTQGSSFRRAILLLGEDATTCTAELAASLWESIPIYRCRPTHPADHDGFAEPSPGIAPAAPLWPPARHAFGKFTANVLHVLPREATELFAPATTAARAIMSDDGGTTVKPRNVGSFGSFRFIDPGRKWDVHGDYRRICKAAYNVPLCLLLQSTSTSDCWDPNGGRNQIAARVRAKLRELMATQDGQHRLLLASASRVRFRQDHSWSRRHLSERSIDLIAPVTLAHRSIPRTPWSNQPLGPVSLLRFNETITAIDPDGHTAALIFQSRGHCNEHLQQTLDTRHDIASSWFLIPSFVSDHRWTKDEEGITSKIQHPSLLSLSNHAASTDTLSQLWNATGLHEPNDTSAIPERLRYGAHGDSLQTSAELNGQVEFEQLAPSTTEISEVGTPQNQIWSHQGTKDRNLDAWTRSGAKMRFIRRAQSAVSARSGDVGE